VIASISGGLDLGGVPDFLTVSARAGATFVMVREPALSARALSDLTREIVSHAARCDLRVLVNDRLDVALAAGAQGVHLRADGPPVATVRAMTPDGFVIGRSAHSDDEIDRAAGADYLLYGTIFATPSKPGTPGQGLAALAWAVTRFAGPVLAIGGITAENVADVRATGAAGFAAIRMFRIQ
jgi:thiamine-phosphate pyrophosphorylase